MCVLFSASCASVLRIEDLLFIDMPYYNLLLVHVKIYLEHCVRLFLIVHLSSNISGIASNSACGVMRPTINVRRHLL